ncbi:MAG: hypothetical protein II849_07745 [Bacteroidales bacterium]|nr:hypothetical protein [Bacteroidales bacterium]
MKHLKTTALLLLMATALMAACSKEEGPAFAEKKIIGTWRIPLNLPSEVLNAAGQKVIFNEDHTAIYNNHLFSTWKIEGMDIICSNYTVANGSRDVDVMKFTVNSINDSVMIANVQYTHTLDNYVVEEGDLTGMYTRIKENNQPNQ